MHGVRPHGVTVLDHPANDFRMRHSALTDDKERGPGFDVAKHVEQSRRDSRMRAVVIGQGDATGVDGIDGAGNRRQDPTPKPPRNAPHRWRAYHRRPYRLAGDSVGISRQPGEGAMDRSDAPFAVSVIVPCHGALDHVTELVDSLLVQDAPFAWEAIFVDNNLTPAERKRLEDAVRPLAAVRIIEERAQGISPARNTGAAAAGGEVLAFIDSDDVAAATWLRALTEAVAPGSIAAGRLEVERLNPPWLARTRGGNDPAKEYLVEGVYPVAPGGNMAITANDFNRLGGFGAGADALEDFEFCFRAWTGGMAVRPAGSEAMIHYRLRQEPRALYRQGYRYGLARARVYRTLVDRQLVKRWSVSGWRSWAMLGLIAPMAAFSRTRRASAAWILGNRLGRLSGSIRYRVIYV